VIGHDACGRANGSANEPDIRSSGHWSIGGFGCAIVRLLDFSIDFQLLEMHIADNNVLNKTLGGCMTRVVVCLLIGFYASVSAQSVDHWWLPQEHSGEMHRSVILYGDGEGLFCVAVKDSIEAVTGDQTNMRSYLSLHRIGADDVMHSKALRENGPYASVLFSWEGAEWELAVGKTGSGAMLLASTYWEWSSGCLGSAFRSADTLRLEAFWNDGSRLLAAFDSARRPVLLSTRNGDAWLAWESASVIEQPDDSLDARYRAVINVVRIAADNTLHDLQVIGEGYEPRLVERSDGAVFLLRRTCEHSTSRSGIGLSLRRIDAAGGVDVPIAEGYSSSPYDRDAPVIKAGAGGEIHVAWRCGDSLTFFRCASDLTVRRSRSAMGSTTLMPSALLDDAGDNALLIWRQKYNEDLSWSASEQGEIFDAIRAIPGTATNNEWSAQRGSDGFIKLVCYDGSAASLRLYPNATGDASINRVIFSLTEPRSSMTQWQLLDEGTLWISHTIRDDDLSQHSGIYRLTDVSLRAHTAPPVANDLLLGANYPNPFNASTTIGFTLPRSMPVTLIVTDVLGREVRSLVDGRTLDAGEHAIPFEASGLAPGLYFTRLKTADRLAVGRMILTR
jgi:hypothetical protein